MGKKVLKKTCFVFSLFIVALAIVALDVVLFVPQIKEKTFPPKPENTVENPVLRKVLHPENSTGVYFGASIDWTAGDTPSQFNSRLGRPAAIYQFFTELHDSIQNLTDLKYVIDVIGKTDGILALTVMPLQGFDVLTDASVDQVVRTMAEINKAGIPVLLRFCHEMNGNWYPFGQKPILFIKWFRIFADAIHKAAPLTRMVWSPNVGRGYPWFETGNKNQPVQGSDDYKAMDTNGDGKVDNEDSPFLAFWPGSEYVDWIGYSVFHFGSPDDYTANAIPEDNEFAISITNPTNTGKLYDIYTDFAQKYQKPMGIMETAAAYYPSGSKSVSALDIKRGWWRQIFNKNIFAKYPYLKIICWFDVTKTEYVNDGNVKPGTQNGLTRDFSVTKDPNILANFKADLDAAGVWFADSQV